MNREYAAVVDYLREENHVLRELLQGKRIRLPTILGWVASTLLPRRVTEPL